jgi:hypothetical protein
MAKFRPVELSDFVKEGTENGSTTDNPERDDFKENVSFGVTSLLNGKH